MAVEKKQNQHRRTRADHAMELAEDYVEAIADIVAANGVCRTVDLARRFQVSHVTVSRAVDRLQRAGYVDREPYGPVCLTLSGRRLAHAARRRHEIVFRFLRAIGVREATARADSEGIEHHVSRETLSSMRRFLEGGRKASSDPRRS